MGSNVAIRNLPSVGNPTEPICVGDFASDELYSYVETLVHVLPSFVERNR
jgi:hypothetical protein